MNRPVDLDMLAEHDAGAFVRALHSVSSLHAPIFVCSFCRAADDYANRHGLLSQWRGYGPDGGIAICFSFDGLKKIVDAEHGAYQYTGIFFGDVIYGEADQEFAEAQKHIDSFSRAIPEIVRESLQSIGIDYELEDSDGTKLSDLYSPYFSVAPRLKHPGFSEENEYRIVLPVVRHDAAALSDKRKRKEILFKPKLNYLLPFIKFNEDTGIKLPIERIIIGPSLDAERRLASVSFFMRENEYDVEVSVSETPFA